MNTPAAIADTAPTARASAPLWPWSAYAALIAAAGLPIYIHAPKAYVDSYGVSLAALGGVLAGLRAVDVVQDPLLGWLAEATQARRGAMVAGAAAIMAGAMLGLFAVVPPVAPLLWFALMLTVLFSAYSFLSIVFYAAGVARAQEMSATGGHVRLATWRETGGLLGVCAAAIAPSILVGTGQPFAVFALAFAALAVVASFAMRHEWAAAPAPLAAAEQSRQGLAAFQLVLADRSARRLLVLALVNAAPVAVTSTLFLFFVESRLQLAGWEGAFLLLFFLSAAASAALWGRLAARWGERATLALGMALSIASFLWALGLGAGDAWPFAVISVASGAALGADMVLLPALFARRLAQLGQGWSAGFGLWSFASKLSLALAAAVILPLLDAAGFVSSADPAANSADVLWLLTLLYAGLPCALKCAALGMLALFPSDQR